jgi:putative DNA methylase
MPRAIFSLPPGDDIPPRGTNAMKAPKRKLIEVGIPLKTINEEAAREKSIRHGHPSTLHLWWARRPLAAARAVLFAQLVDDPSSNPDRFPTEKDVARERERLHKLIEQLVVWENSNNEKLLVQAHLEILDSTGGDPPPILDPFAGGGTIPLEAQRLGLDAHASDLNPVAVLITKALVEIPPRFAGRHPVCPEVTQRQLAHPWPRATGLAEDVRQYGRWMREEAERRIGHLYPKATLPDGTQAIVIAWIWARTVACPNPACQITMPLVRSWWLGKKKGKEAYVIPSVVDGRVEFAIGHDIKAAPTDGTTGTVHRSGATCVGCGAAVDMKYIRAEGRAGRMGQQLMATVAEGNRARFYLCPTPEHEAAAHVDLPIRVPEGAIATNPRWFSTPAFGITEFADLFTPRQLVALTTLSDLVEEARELAMKHALSAGLPEGDRLEVGGDGAAAYADAVATYLGLAVSKLTDRCSTITNWYVSRESTSSTFARQALPMAWDFSETHPLGTNTGSFSNAYLWTCDTVQHLYASGAAWVEQADAISRVRDNRSLISTDPPYYDNIGYSDLSDYFYVWLRRSLHQVYPELLSTMLVPKAEELVANPYRHNGKEGAKNFFEEGFREVFTRARTSALPDFPITVYYAFKQSETTDAGQTSTGWETLLEGMIGSGWSVTATWPLRSELGNRMLSQGTNALASSILLALRPRPEYAERTDRRRFIAALKNELPKALRELQQGAIAPVDLPQAAIGPGMAVFSRYSTVLEDDGSKMSVRAALARINEVLDEVLMEQEGDFDADSRFAIAWFRQFGFDQGPYGHADNIARARNASIEHLSQAGILTSRAGKVALLAPDRLDITYDPATDPSISSWEVVMHLTRVLATSGIPAASELLARVPASIERDLCKELAFLLFSISESRKETKLAVDFNALGTAWNEIAAVASTAATRPSQQTMDFEGD